VASAIDPLIERCRAAGQAALADNLAGLTGPSQQSLAAQVARLDLDLIADLCEQFVGAGDETHELGTVAPAGAIALPTTEVDRQRDEMARERGEQHLGEGKVGLVLLAGGQGSRLGFDGPKGNFPFAPITGRTLFDFFAARIDALRMRFDTALPWFIMTSPVNDGITRDTFAQANYFGLDPDSVHFMVQGTMPAVDAKTGQILLEAPDRISLSPDGHGGLLGTLRRSGALDLMAEAGIETLFTFQVDNPLVRIARPEFLGHHLFAGAEMSNIAVRKTTPDEKVGLIATIDGRAGVIEYSDLPDELANQREPDGRLSYWAGSIAIHCLERKFVERLTEGRLGLPFHRALKKVPHIDAAGQLVTPTEPNGIKFETFLFDALPLAHASVTLEAAREEEFSPIKNGEGTDSAETARIHMNRLYAGWFESAGVPIPRDDDGEPVDLEIDPRVALDSDELRDAIPADFEVTGPTALGLSSMVSTD
jgi:UDP-N-acetylglucosamine/UDP-N-acetylgalactosamine diphosphorylase